MAGRMSLLRKELSQFLHKHAAAASVSLIDEVVLSYLGSVMESLHHETASNSEPTFNVNEFAETMEAYLPGFSGISSAEICYWMSQVSPRVKQVAESSPNFTPISSPPTSSQVQSAARDRVAPPAAINRPPTQSPIMSNQSWHRTDNSPQSRNVEVLPVVRQYSQDATSRSGSGMSHRRANRLRQLDSMVETAPLKASHQPWAKMKRDSSPTYKVDAGASPRQQDFQSMIHQQRQNTSHSIATFAFNEKRVRVLSRTKDCSSGKGGILYWMSRDQRVQDNWALLYAQKLALKHGVPLHVAFCLVPRFLDATIRHYRFMMKGLHEVEKECQELDIGFHLLIGFAKDQIPQFVSTNEISAVICDFSPLRVPLEWVNAVKDTLPANVLFSQVDAHNVVPCWEASTVLEEQAYHFRPKMKKLIPGYLTEFPPVIRHPHKPRSQPQVVDWDAADASLEVNRDVAEVTWATPGTRGGLAVLEKFIKERLYHYEEDRNNPVTLANSDMSPWFHFGQVSAQRAMLMVQPYRHKYPKCVDKYLEQGIVRRELCDNFCYYNKNYDNFEGCYGFGRETLLMHKSDERDYVYSQEQLEAAQTHDNLWNAAQIQLVEDGKMHGFLRMYWAKKILEWTESPELALHIAIHLNDKYSLDGRDPNGYVGCMWSICGIHDHAFGERPVVGQIRWMSYHASLRKFDVPAFIKKYTGKTITTEPLYPQRFSKPRR